jgi:hypothetical protein
MAWMEWLAIGLGAFPFWEAWRANRRSTLRDALLWAAAAWASWGVALTHPESDDFGYVGLCLTGCAGIAVLGARRPQVAAWNFVVLGLAGVMTLPLLEGMIMRVDSFNIERKIFLMGILLVGIVNYAPTRFRAAALALGAAAGFVYLRITYGSDDGHPLRSEAANAVTVLLLGIAPWLAWRTRPPVAGNALDAQWLSFRDRFGYLWGSRIRDQFNAAAKNAELAVRLGWRQSVNAANASEIERAIAILKSLTKRFERDSL